MPQEDKSVIDMGDFSLVHVQPELQAVFEYVPVNTVRRHLTLTTAPKYERKVKRVTKLADYEAYLCERQKAAHPEWITSVRLC